MEQPPRGPMLDDNAAVGEENFISDLLGEAHFVGDEDAGHAVARELADNGQHLLDHLGIKRGRDLVEQDDGGLHRDGPSDGDALLLATGQFGRISVLLAGQVTFARSCTRALADLVPVLAQHLDRRHDEVLKARSGAGKGCIAGTPSQLHGADGTKSTLAFQRLDTEAANADRPCQSG